MPAARALAAVVCTAALAAACSSGTSTGSAGSKTTTSMTTTASARRSATAPGPPPTCAPRPSGGTGSPSAAGGDVNPPGDIPDNVAFVRFTPPSHRYSLRVPEGWARTDGPADSVQFTDKLNTIRVEVAAAATAPTVDTANALDLPAIRADATCFEPVTVDQVGRTSGPVVRIVYRADGRPDPVTGKVVHDDVQRYEFWRAGTEAIVTLSGPQGSDNVDAWRLVTDSFTWG